MYGNSFPKLIRFFYTYTPRLYKKGETILRPGDHPQGVYFIEKGYVRLFSVSYDGKELTLVIYKAGEFFPVVWTYFGEKPSIYWFQTMSKCKIRRVKKEEFIDFLHNNPEVSFDITKHIVLRFQIALKRMERLTFGSASSRLASILLICCNDYGIKMKGMMRIDIALTHRDLSSLVGVTRETVSIELKKFEKMGIIGHKRGKIVVLSMKKLEKHAVL